MLVVGIEEEFCVVDLFDDLVGGIDVTLVDEVWVGIRAVDLDWDAVGLWFERLFAVDWDGGIEEQGFVRFWPRLGELLGDRHTKQKPNIYELNQKIINHTKTARTKNL